MSPEEMKELINTTINETNLYSGLIIALLPAVIVLLTNIIYDGIKRKKDFIKKYKIEQLKILYLPLYSVLAQSEYYKKINKIEAINEKGEISFYEFKRERDTISFGTAGFSSKSENIETPVTKFDKNYLVSLVIDKKEFASTKLIKLAVSLRFLIENGEGILKDKATLEENRVINEFIRLIVKETNNHLKYCKMKYDKVEISSGSMNIDI